MLAQATAKPKLSAAELRNRLKKARPAPAAAAGAQGPRPGDVDIDRVKALLKAGALPGVKLAGDAIIGAAPAAVDSSGAAAAAGAAAAVRKRARE